MATHETNSSPSADGQLDSSHTQATAVNAHHDAEPTAVEVAAKQIKQHQLQDKIDLLSIEEPLEIVIIDEKDSVIEEQSLVVTMRTPGNDLELAAGFLYTEGIIETYDQIDEIRLGGPNTGEFGLQNKVFVRLSAGHQLDLKRFQRNFYTNSSCGICGKTSIQALSMLRNPHIPPDVPRVSWSTLQKLPSALLKHQVQFSQTGGIHAAALFDVEGNILDIREDIGRHNALDKLIGAQLLNKRLPLTNTMVLVSGRAGFELIQKAVMAEIPILAAVGAPSSLALELAQEYGITLVGFLREQSFNIYNGEQRLFEGI